MVLFKVLIAAVVLAAALPAAGQEYSDYKQFGDCQTATASDPILGQVGAYFLCGREETYFGGGQDPSRPGVIEVGVQTEGTKRMADETPLQELAQYGPLEVKFRVDDGEILTGSGPITIDGYIYVRNDALARELIRQVAAGQKLHFSIAGQLSHTIDLNGSAAAVADMLRRLKGAAP